MRRSSDLMGILCRASREEEGAVMVEFGLILPILIMLLVLCTDYALSVLAANQVEAAADAAAQYVLVNGWDGTASERQLISNAGTTAFTNLPSAYASPAIVPLTIDPTSDIQFECGATNSGTYTTSGSFSTSTACAAGGYPYVTITAHGLYTPIFAAWWAGLVNGKLPLQYSVTTRFQ